MASNDAQVIHAMYHSMYRFMIDCDVARLGSSPEMRSRAGGMRLAHGRRAYNEWEGRTDRLYN